MKIKPLHFIFLGAFITIIGALMPSFTLFIGETPIKVNWIAIIGGLISGVAALLHNIGSSNKSTKILDNTIMQLKQIQELTMQNAELSRELSNANIKFLNAISGGDAYLKIKLVNHGPWNFKLEAINNFDHNLPNTVLKIQNYSELEKCPKIEVDGNLYLDGNCIKPHTIEKPAQGYNSNCQYGLGVDKFIIKSEEKRKIGIMMFTPTNQFYVQILYQLIDQSRTFYTYRVLKYVNGKYVTIESNTDIPNPLDQPTASWEDMFPIDPQTETQEV